MKFHPIWLNVLWQRNGICMLLALSLVAHAHSEQAEKPVTQTEESLSVHRTAPLTDESRVLHITVINMSGKHREALLHRAVIELPVAQRIDLQMRSGETFRIRSDTNSKTDATFVVDKGDAGRLIAVR